MKNYFFLNSEGSGTMRAAGHEPQDGGTLKHPSKDPSPPIPPKVSYCYSLKSYSTTRRQKVEGIFVVTSFELQNFCCIYYYYFCMVLLDLFWLV